MPVLFVKKEFIIWVSIKLIRSGASNCSWTSCREGCTRELYDCTQIRVNYKLPINITESKEEQDNEDDEDGREGKAVGGVKDDENRIIKAFPRYRRSLRDYDYIDDVNDEDDSNEYEETESVKTLSTGKKVVEKKKTKIYSGQ